MVHPLPWCWTPTLNDEGEKAEDDLGLHVFIEEEIALVL